MSSYINVPALKFKQDEIDSRRAKLLQVFVPFQDGVIKRLEQFAEEAAKCGLRDVKPCEKKDADEFVEISLMLNGLDIVMIATNDVAAIESSTKPLLASKILIYPGDSADNEPQGEMVVQESDGEAYICQMNWLENEGDDKSRIAIEHIRSIEDAEEAGRKTASALIKAFYGFMFYWQARPTFGAMTSRTTEKKRPLGFYIKKGNDEQLTSE